MPQNGRKGGLRRENAGARDRDRCLNFGETEVECIREMYDAEEKLKVVAAEDIRKARLKFCDKRGGH